MRRWYIWIALAVAIVALAVNVGAATAYFYDGSRADVISEGVSIVGIPVGGMTTAAAAATLQRRLVPRLERPVTLVYRKRRFTLDPGRAGLRVDVDAMVARALELSRDGSLLHRVVRDVRGRRLDASVPLQGAYGERLLEQFVDRVDRSIHRPAHAARVIPSADSLTMLPSHDGIEVRRGVLDELLADMLFDTHAPRQLAVPTRVIRAKVTLATLPRRYPAYITVDRSHFRLTFWQGLKPYRRYTIAVGRQGLETPAGVYSIDDKQVNPSWHVPLSSWAGDLAGKVIPPGPDDPIKARWMGFYNGAGIHGTDELSSLGSAASHGCIRMAIPDVEQLYDLVPLGTPIYVG
jgi:hypothetical protein